MANTRCKILLIEDDKVDQIAFKHLIKDENLPYDCTIAESVSEARNILDSKPFDVVISDHLLGDGTAFDVLGSVKNTPIIFVTGAGDEEIAVRAMKAGACDYLIKDPGQNYLKLVPRTIENAIKHKKIEETLDRKQKALEAIFDAVPVGMLLVDENFIVKRVNDAIRQMVGKEYSQIINRRVGDVLCCINSTYNEKGCGYSPACAECLLLEMAKTVLDSGQPVHAVEIKPTLKIGNKEITPWLSIGAEPATIEECKHVVVAINDITKRKKAEEKLKETMELKSQFISMVSHELRTPLTCTKEAIAVVLDGIVGKINDEQKHFLDIAKRNVDRLARFINEVLNFQKLEAGVVRLNIQENDISEVVEEVHKTMASSAEKKKIDFSLEVDDNLPKASFDSDKVFQALTDLVNNAIKFTPERGQVRVFARCQGQELVINVSDTGIGIPQEALLKIFDRFYRVDQPHKKIPGTGLGLAIVKQIVIMHGGRIEVKSKLGEGTTFTVFLPLAGKSTVDVSSAKLDEVLDTLVSD